MSWIKEAEFSTECFGDLTRVWCDLWSLRRHGNEYLHKEVTRWNISGIKRTNEANFVLRICGVKAEFFMKLSNRRLLRGFISFYLAARQGNLPPMATVLCATN